MVRDGLELRLKEAREAISSCSMNHSFIQELELVLNQFPITFQTSLQYILTLINDLQVQEEDTWYGHVMLPWVLPPKVPASLSMQTLWVTELTQAQESDEWPESPLLKLTANLC